MDGTENIQAQGQSHADCGCSPFFFTSSILSLVNGYLNRKMAKKNAEDDIEFQCWLSDQKEFYEDNKEKMDVGFKKYLKSKQREFTRLENQERFANDLTKTDLKPFFRGWPLETEIETIIRKRKDIRDSGTLPMNFVVGNDNDDASNFLTKRYKNVVDRVRDALTHIVAADVNVYRFKDKAVSGGPALANIFAMLNNIPTIVIMSQIDNMNHKIPMHVGIWNQDSPFPFQQMVDLVDYEQSLFYQDKEYFDKKTEEVKHTFVTIAAVLNDAYSLVESLTEPRYPQYAINNRIAEKYPKLAAYAVREYKDMITTITTASEYEGEMLVAGDALFKKADKERIVEKLTMAINSLK